MVSLITIKQMIDEMNTAILNIEERQHEILKKIMEMDNTRYKATGATVTKTVTDEANSKRDTTSDTSAIWYGKRESSKKNYINGRNSIDN